MVLEELDQLVTKNICVLKTSCRTSSSPDLKRRNEAVNFGNRCVNPFSWLLLLTCFSEKDLRSNMAVLEWV